MKDLRLKHLVCRYALFLLLVVRFRPYRKDSVIKIQGAMLGIRRHTQLSVAIQLCLLCAKIVWRVQQLSYTLRLAMQTTDF